MIGRKKGCIPWNKGLTKETSEIIINASIKSSETKKRLFKEGKLKSWNKGLILEDKRGIKNPEHSKRMSGSGNPMFGKKHSLETIKKIITTQRKCESFKCLKCGKERYYPPSHYNKFKNHFCSKKCYGLYKIKGSTEFRKGILHTEWRNRVITKDGHMCQVSKYKGNKLIAHHLDGFAEYPELRFVVSNGITLSKDIHDLFHKNYGYGNNTREQFIRFFYDYMYKPERLRRN